MLCRRVIEPLYSSDAFLGYYLDKRGKDLIICLEL